MSRPTIGCVDARRDCLFGRLCCDLRVDVARLRSNERPRGGEALSDQVAPIRPELDAPRMRKWSGEGFCRQAGVGAVDCVVPGPDTRADPRHRPARSLGGHLGCRVVATSRQRVADRQCAHFGQRSDDPRIRRGNLGQAWRSRSDQGLATSACGCGPRGAGPLDRRIAEPRPVR